MLTLKMEEGAKRAKECQGSLGTDKGKERIPFLEPLEGAQPCLDLDYSPMRPVEPQDNKCVT